MKISITGFILGITCAFTTGNIKSFGIILLTFFNVFNVFLTVIIIIMWCALTGTDKKESYESLSDFEKAILKVPKVSIVKRILSWFFVISAICLFIYSGFISSAVIYFLMEFIGISLLIPRVKELRSMDKLKGVKIEL